MPLDLEEHLSRRDIVKAAVAIGGSAALSACQSIEQPVETEDQPDVPRSQFSPEEQPERQHAWSEYLVTDGHGNTAPPRHQILLFLNYDGPIPPTKADRSTVDAALQTVERAYQRGTGGNDNATLNEGVLFTLGYSNAYFNRFERSLPSKIDLKPADEVISSLEENATADQHDALLLLTSDFASNILAVESALFGSKTSLNGLDIDDSLQSVFSVAERRTGVVGTGAPAEKFPDQPIPEGSPLSMGFRSGFRDTIPAEDKVTIADGPFAGGTTQLASRMNLDLNAWYDLDEDERVKRMFSRKHTPEMVGSVGEGLGDHSGITESVVDELRNDDSPKCPGHAAKTAMARDDDFEPKIIRRSEGLLTNEGDPAFNFVSIQRGIEAFVETRKAMNGEQLQTQSKCREGGILEYLTVENRATLLVPPRSKRALPAPEPS